MSASTFARRAAAPLAAALFVFCASAVALCQTPEKVLVCRVQEDPAAFNHKLIEVTGFVSHGFEDFGLFDPSCPARAGSSRTSLWLEYGGKASSNTMYCCGVTPSRTRPKPLVVEKIPVTLLDDKTFKQFDKMIQRPHGSTVHATLVGRFFAGDEMKWPAGTFWGGYGHLGCCSLLAVQQVVSVDPQDNKDLDYVPAPDQPDIERAGCGYKFLTRDGTFDDVLDAQRQAEGGTRAWAFEDPRRVAAEGLAQFAKLDEKTLERLTETRRAQGRVVFRLFRAANEPGYMVVVNRPYVLSFYAKDPKRVAWVVSAAYETSCGGDTEVTMFDTGLTVNPPARLKTRRARQRSRRR
jgi:hypothetical protein